MHHQFPSRSPFHDYRGSWSLRHDTSGDAHQGSHQSRYEQYSDWFHCFSSPRELVVGDGASQLVSTNLMQDIQQGEALYLSLR